MQAGWFDLLVCPNVDRSVGLKLLVLVSMAATCAAAMDRKGPDCLLMLKVVVCSVFVVSFLEYQH